MRPLPPQRTAAKAPLQRQQIRLVALRDELDAPVLRRIHLAGQHVLNARLVRAHADSLALRGQIGQHAQHARAPVQAQIRILRFARGDVVLLPVGQPRRILHAEFVEGTPDLFDVVQIAMLSAVGAPI